jgi:hypothetical protein
VELAEPVICPVCGPDIEAEILDYLVDKVTRKRVGFICQCGAIMLFGSYQGIDLLAGR